MPKSNGYRSRDDVSVQDLSFRVKAIVGRETEVIRAQLKRNEIAIYQGSALFLDPHTLGIQGAVKTLKSKLTKSSLLVVRDQHTARRLLSTIIELSIRTTSPA